MPSHFSVLPLYRGLNRLSFGTQEQNAYHDRRLHGRMGVGQYCYIIDHIGWRC